MKADVVVLGAGIIGVSTAVHLAKRGKSVVLVDRKGPGEETSFGNGGLIQREGIYPYGFPRDLGKLLRYALNRSVDVHYHAAALPGLVPFMVRYWANSAPARHRAIARLYAALIERSTDEHAALIEEAGAGELIRKDGWIESFRTPAARDAAYREAEALSREFGVSHEKLSGTGLALIEPSLTSEFSGGVRWAEPWAVRDPHSLTMAYVALFERHGGTVVSGDAATLTQSAGGWGVVASGEAIEAGAAVVALGPWACALTRKLGYRLPLAIKRGYHMHYRPGDGAVLNNWILDAEAGYLLAPMAQGIRLTTGAEFAHLDAPKTPVQLQRAERIARAVFPLGERIDAEPWLGARPCTPDMMPIIGPATRHENLWFAFGHAHHGLTLGPVTGRLLAEQMTGEVPTIDPRPYWPHRFER